MAEDTLGITVGKKEDFSEWYTQVVTKAELADYSLVSGCMVLRPGSFAIWEKIQSHLDGKFKETGHKNVYFPLFIPESLLTKESDHVEGFSPEVAWVTHAGDSPLNERLAIRPTSETIMYDSYSKWLRSWRDLPFLYNQWCSVVRWEFKYPRPFLRTREFLWQEGHTVHETQKDAVEEVMQILHLYRDTIEQEFAIPVIIGKKTEKEKFAGADFTTTLEAMMPDGKALQMGTSHHLAQNFAKPFGLRFQGRDGKEQIPWQTSWGVSTRLIGAIIMAHGDDKGLVLPPNVAPLHVAIVPILFEDTREKVIAAAEKLKTSLNEYSVELDLRDHKPGWKFNDWEMKGVPIRIEIGPRDVDNNQVVVARRDTGEKQTVAMDDVAQQVRSALEEMQKSLFDVQKKFLDSNIRDATTIEDLKKNAEEEKWSSAFFCGKEDCEEDIKEKTGGITTRVVPFNADSGSCLNCGKKGPQTYFAKAY